MSDPAAVAIRIRGLTKRYGESLAVDRLDLDVASGETLALLGPNGAGKTTTIECCEGYRVADAGEVRVLGLDPVRDARRLRPRIGLMLQEGGVYPLATPREMLRLFAAFHTDPRDPDELLASLELEGSARTRYRDLSGGQKQRLSLALALVGRPELLFLDEPSSGLDVAARHRSWALIDQLRAAGVTIVLTTHLLDEAQRLADRVAIIDRGRLVAVGTPAALADLGGHGVELWLDEPLDPAVLSAALEVEVTVGADGRYLLAVDGTPELLAAVTRALSDHGVRLRSLRNGHTSLEEVFLRMTETPGPGHEGAA